MVSPAETEQLAFNEFLVLLGGKKILCNNGKAWTTFVKAMGGKKGDRFWWKRSPSSPPTILDSPSSYKAMLGYVRDRRVVELSQGDEQDWSSPE